MKKALSILWLTTIALFAISQNCTNCDENNTVTPENYSSALGIENTSTGQASFASGRLDTVTGSYATGLGYRAIATGEISFAAGGVSKATGVGAFSFGHHIVASGSKSFVIGTGGSSTGLLTNNNPNSLMIGFGSNKSTMFIGTASDSDKTGAIGIGDVTNPDAKVHIKSDYGEESAMLIEPWTWNSGQWSEVRIGTANHAIRVSGSYGMEFKTENNYIFNSTDAKVGIGTPTPTEKLEVDGNVKVTDGNIFIDNNEGGVILKSPDGQCWKITVNNSGELTTTLIDCNLITENNNEVQSNTQHFKIYPNPTKNKIKIESSWDSYHMVKVTDMNGALVIAEEIFSGTNELSLKNLSKGYYIVTIINEGNKTLFSEKIIKNSL